MLATMLAVAMVADDLMAGAKTGRRRVLLAAAPLILVTILCTAWRIA
jgi:hypothetical protein